MIETVFAVGPVYDAAMCFAKAVSNLIWGATHTDKVRVCKDTCNVTADCPEFKEPLYGNAEHGIQGTKMVRGQCVEGLCLKCRRGDEKCRFDTDCTSGFCSGNHMGMRDGRCLSRNLPVGAPCVRDTECKSHICAGWYRGHGYKGSCKMRKFANKTKRAVAQAAMGCSVPGTHQKPAGCDCVYNKQCKSKSCAGNKFGLAVGTCTTVGPKVLAELETAAEALNVTTVKEMQCQPPKICCVANSKDQRSKSAKFISMFSSKKSREKKKTSSADFVAEQCATTDNTNTQLRDGSTATPSTIPANMHCYGPVEDKKHTGDKWSDTAVCTPRQYAAGECICQQCPQGFLPIAFDNEAAAHKCCPMAEVGGQPNLKATSIMGDGVSECGHEERGKHECFNHTNAFDDLVNRVDERRGFRGKVTKNMANSVFSKPKLLWHEVYLQVNIMPSGQLRQYRPSNLVWSSKGKGDPTKPLVSDLSHLSLSPNPACTAGQADFTKVTYHITDKTVKIEESCKNKAPGNSYQEHFEVSAVTTVPNCHTGLCFKTDDMGTFIDLVQTFNGAKEPQAAC